MTSGRSLHSPGCQFPQCFPLSSPCALPTGMFWGGQTPTGRITDIRWRRGPLAGVICGPQLPGPPLVAMSQHCWRQHGDVTPHQPSLHPQPSTPGTPWQPRDQRQKRSFVPGEGEAREGIQGAAPDPGMWQDFETPRTRVPQGQCRATLAYPCPLSVPQSLLGLLPASLRSLPS